MDMLVLNTLKLPHVFLTKDCTITTNKIVISLQQDVSQITYLCLFFPCPIPGH